MHLNPHGAFAALLLVVALPAPSHAVQPHAHQPAGLQVKTGRPVRSEVSVTHAVPPSSSAGRAWLRFQTRVGGQWQAMWDRDTRVPSRIYGSGIATPGAVANPGRAERHAREILSRHLDLLAPGSSASDFVLVSNEVHRGMRIVGFHQHHQGRRVLGGQLSFRFKNDRLFVIGSEALPFVAASSERAVSDDAAVEAARKWLLADAAQRVVVRSVSALEILPLVSSGSVRYATTIAVTLDAESPIGRWKVFVDATSGQVVAREQLLRFANGNVYFNVPDRSPYESRSNYLARDTAVTVGGQMSSTDGQGVVGWDGNSSTNLTLQPRGSLVHVSTATGELATTSLPIDPDQQAVWDSRNDESVDSQLTTYIHGRIVKDYAKGLNANLDWLDEALIVNTNINDTCNAFSDGDSINFFVSSDQCANTGLLADVVYHEFGHSLHAHSIIEGVGAFDGAFSEGLSDYLAATITGDPRMGIGFFRNESPLRHIDPSSGEHVWPDDIGEVHFTGLIFAGAMWDLRKILVARLGEEDGVALSDRLFYATLQRSTNIPATYVEVLAEDDDDGNLENGTPNICDINTAFGPHGLRAVRSEVFAPTVTAPDEDGFEIRLSVTGLNATCPGDSVASATIAWVIRDTNTAGDVEMVETNDGFVGNIPDAKDGEVVRFSIDVQFADGSSTSYPENPADPKYEMYVGEIVELYCTDFESDPFASGWEHGLSSGEASDGADDWTWGTLQSPESSGDPAAAFSGESVIGNDLGGEEFNGQYQSNKVNFARSPEIDVLGYSDIRLQYRRWLNIEDGHFDRGTIYANGKVAWQNLDSNQGDASTVNHTDSEWRFHDVPLSRHVADGKVRIKYELSSDGGLELGGWTIDDFCIVANANAICGDGELYGPEECDDGDANSGEADACRETCLLPTCGDGIVDTGEFCDDGNDNDADNCTSECLLPGQAAGDCGCVVGRRSGPSSGSLLALFGGLLLLTRLRGRRRV